MSSSDTPHQGLNILCIDGGGARGLSALIIIQELMKRMQYLKGVDSPPYSYQCFDVIAGTGTGAVQACMLGRLRMPVELAIKAYANLANDVFSEKKRYGSGSFKTTKLKDSLTKIIQDATGDPDEPMLERQPTQGQCKTLVFAMSKHNMRAGIPTIFRSYHVAANMGPECTIREALCATLAHPDLFKSFDIGDPPLNQSFVDAGLGCNNPLAHVLTEAKTLYPGRYIASITSIGTGHTRTIQIPDTSFLRHLLPIPAIVAMKAIAADSERVAEEIARRFKSTEDVYFRLSVDQGMQNVAVDGWEQLAEVQEHTHAYMKLVDVNHRIDKLIQALDSRRLAVSAAQIDGEIQVAMVITGIQSTVRRCPAPSPIFTGCEAIIRRVESCISASTMGRKVCVVHGLGGAGKTQIALKVAERTYNQWKEVVFIDATTHESIENAFKDIAVGKGAGNTCKAGLQWLESCYEQWLIIFDNADDPSLPIRDYIPRGNHGSIIITTRLSGMVSLSQGRHSDCNISSMDPDDALALLFKAAQKQDQELSPKEIDDAKELLQELGRFALAVVHAGSFIGQSPHMSISDYRSLLMRHKKQALEAYSKLPQAVKVDEYGHTVYTAWLMCYKRLSPRAQELLWLIASLHHTGIIVDIFRRAAKNIGSYEPTFPTTPLEDSARQRLQTFLCDFVDTSQNWDELLFTETINKISSHSLLDYDPITQAYQIHVLVQGWVHTVIPHDADLAVECGRTLLSVSMPLDASLESVMFRIKIGLHVDKVLLEASGTAGLLNHARPLFEALKVRWQWAKAERLYVENQKTIQQVLGEAHSETLTSTNNLALTYLQLGRFKDARALLSQVLEARKRVLGNDHPDTLTTIDNLGLTYLQLGQLEDASDLNSQALDARKRVLGNDHPDTLKSMNNVALAYFELGRFEYARALQSQVLDARKRVLGNDHPDTLTSMSNLAVAYSKLDRYKDSSDLQSQVLDARKRVLDNDHPAILTSMDNLAITYSQLGRLEDARDLQSQVLDARKRVLGNDHPDTLRIMNNLAVTYSSLGRLEDARTLHLQALDGYKRVLGNDHPYTLQIMKNLAISYSELGRFEDARDLLSQVLDARKRVLGNDHPDTLGSMIVLGLTYQQLGRFEDARDLLSQVLDARKRVLGNDHPDTLRSMNNLANTYSELGRFEDERTLLSQILDAQKRVLGNDHPDTLGSMIALGLTYQQLGRFEDARDLHSQVLDARKRVLGNDHPDTLKSILFLTATHLKLGQFAEAEKLQVSPDKFTQVFGENHAYINIIQEQLKTIQTYHKKRAGGLSWRRILRY